MSDVKRFDAEGFAKYLLSTAVIRQGVEKFYVNWVRLFFKERRQWAKFPWYEQLPCFLELLRDRKKYEDWQIEQAENSVRFYFTAFLGDAKQTEKTVRLVEVDGEGVFSVELAIAEFQQALRLKNYSLRTEDIYLKWVRGFFEYSVGGAAGGITFCLDKTEANVKNYLAYLVFKRRVAAATQNQAFNALLTFFRQVLHLDLTDMRKNVRAKVSKRLPVVFSRDEVRAILARVNGTTGLMISLIYGGGLRIQECLRLRIQDVDFDQNLLYVREGKGDKDRTTILPQALVPGLRDHIERVLELHKKDLAEGYGAVWLPNALERKYPGAHREPAWQWLFPSTRMSVDPKSGVIRRHHLSTRIVQRALKKALKETGIMKHATVHTLRHSFATHLLLSGVDIRQIQDYLGHARVETTMIYTHVVKDMRDPAASPLDIL